MKTKFIKFLDIYLGNIALRLCKKPSASNLSKIKKMLIIRPGGIGDAILLSSTLKTIKQQFPDIYITILGEKRNTSTFLLCPYVDQLLNYDRPKDLFAAINGQYDVVIDSEQWHRLSAVVTSLADASTSIGYATNKRKYLFNHLVQYSHDDYEVDSFCNLFKPLGVTFSELNKYPYLIVPHIAKSRVKILLEGLTKKTFVTIFPGASISEKRWDEKNFANLAFNINKAGYPVIVIGSQKERSAGESIVHGLNALNLAGKTSLMETAAIIEKSSLLVSGDSGVLHIAAGLGKPTVSLFGPSNVKKWAPKGERHVVISRNLPCSPCSKFGYTPKCHINAKCMQDISVEEVFEAVLRLLKDREHGQV